MGLKLKQSITLKVQNVTTVTAWNRLEWTGTATAWADSANGDRIRLAGNSDNLHCAAYVYNGANE
jgi:hypothetical protein